MQSVNIAVGIIVYDFVRDDKRSTSIKSSQAIHGKTKVLLERPASRFQLRRACPYHPGKQVTDPNNDSKALAR